MRLCNWQNSARSPISPKIWLSQPLYDPRYLKIVEISIGKHSIFQYNIWNCSNLILWDSLKESLNSDGQQLQSGTGNAHPSGTPEFTPVFSRVRVTRSLVLCVCFVDRCFSFCPFYFGHCVVCPSIYRFWLPLWYLQTLLPTNINKTNNQLSPQIVKHKKKNRK
jgi:hypothetical protein